MIRFTCDCMLGSLSRNLRMLGFDTIFSRCADLQKTLCDAARQGRILITRRSALAHGDAPVPVCFIAHDRVQDQVIQVLRAHSITPDRLHPFTRCVVCNRPLNPVDKQKAAGKVPEYIFNTEDSFSECSSCGRIYWRGTHYSNMQKKIEDLFSSP